jgi:uncharacterized membrane protein YfcA
MSDIPAEYCGPLDLRAEIQRMDREREETRRFAAECAKLTTEAAKFDAALFPACLWVAGPIGFVIGLVGGISGLTAGIIAVLPALTRLTGCGV